MKKLIVLMALVLLIAACGQSQEEIDASVAQTVEAMTPEETNTPKPTATTKVIKLPTAEPTDTPEPTPEPTLTPIPVPTLNPPMLEEALSKINYLLDEIEGREFLEYKPGAELRYLRSMVYIHPDAGRRIMMVYRYRGQSPLDVKSFIINADGERYTLELCTSNKPVQDGNYIEENVATCFGLADLDIVEQIANSKEVLVRLDGERNHDMELSRTEIVSLLYALRLITNLEEGTVEIKDGAESRDDIWWTIPTIEDPTS